MGRVYEWSEEERAARDAREDEQARLAEKFWPVKLRRPAANDKRASHFGLIDFEVHCGTGLIGYVEVRWRHKWNMVYRSFDMDLQKFKRLAELDRRRQLPVIVLVRLGVEGHYWFRPRLIPEPLPVRRADDGGGRRDRGDPLDRDDQVQIDLAMMESVMLGPQEFGCSKDLTEDQLALFRRRNHGA